ncbi:outer membrane protein OmpA-like peptidoglycan-associated protein [Panacagrimonas perspica]|uniref:Outer membrane protein OmpA-like peptidoglycan-associated protein n=1 Tax=Panacagrimonas perspica TaxID=381431 RepID=A0A4V3URW2_9GAMM|nr:OmpA family protein [Panacagrimonas perspica]TDU32049.1 outer membrane protein OmpA-like peptidoglycan-associated protein [Panacagrimonas perspica]THD04421.1 hypothetical protein B1810_05290 [Panacagrimonas perspica]
MARDRFSALRKFALVGAACSAAPFAVQAGEGFYIGAFGGVNDLENQSYDISDYTGPAGPLVPAPDDGSTLTRIQSDLGYLAGLRFGYSMGPFRPELEFAYRTNDVDKQREIIYGLLGPREQRAVSKGDSTHGVTGMANLWIDFLKSSSSINPYVGGGAGMIDFELKDATYNGNRLGKDNDTVFAWQLGAGVAWALSDRLDLTLDYRYLKSDDAQFDLLPGTVGSVETEYESHSAMLGVRFYFSGSKQEAAPAETPPPEVGVVPVLEAPPVPPPAPSPPCHGPDGDKMLNLEGCKTGDTIVLRGVNFEFNKSSLTINAKTILDQVADALAARPDIKVEIDGHTDARGSDSYNQQLSEKRASTVTRYLAGKGIAGSRMTSVGLGEAQPVADNETDEGRELNRRVELKVLESNGGVTTEAPAADAAP